MKTKTQCSLKLRLIVASLIAEMVKNPPVMQETPGWIPGLGRSPGEGIGYPLQYSGPENSVDYIVHGVAKSRTRLSDFHFQFYYALLCSPLLLPWSPLSMLTIPKAQFKFYSFYES